MRRTKVELYRIAEQHRAGFVANVICNQFNKQVKKLKGLVRLLEAGIDVAMASFSIDHILVDGVAHEMSWLEPVADWNDNQFANYISMKRVDEIRARVNADPVLKKAVHRVARRADRDERYQTALVMKVKRKRGV